MDLLTRWHGLLLLEGAEVSAHQPFPSDVDALARRLAILQAGGVLDEEREYLADNPGTGVFDLRLASLGVRRTRTPPHVHLTPAPDPALLHAANLIVAEGRTAAGITPDLHIAELVRVMDTHDLTLNLLFERLRDGAELGEDGAEPIPDEQAWVDRLAKAIGHAGLPGHINQLARTIRDLQAERARVEATIEAEMETHLPHLKVAIGPNVGARLLALAGGLGRLARAPASTIQTLGAEQALFRHLRGKGRPPKHGIIFQHPNVHRAERHQRGRISRMYAGYIAVAARIDLYGEEDRRGWLEERIGADLDRIRGGR